MNCQEWMTVRHDWVSDNLDPQRSEEAEAHSVACTACSEAAEHLNDLIGALTSLPEVDPRVTEAPVRPGLRFLLGLAAGILLAFGVTRLLHTEPDSIEGRHLAQLRDGAWEPVQGPVPLRNGAQFRLDRSSARGKFSGHSMTIREGSEFRVVDQSTIEVIKGLFHFRGEGADLALQTPAGTVDVVGTEFWLEVSEMKDTFKKTVIGVVLGVTVTAGAVAISNDHGKVRVRSGETGIATKDKAPEVVDLRNSIRELQEERKRLRAEAPDVGELMRLREELAKLERVPDKPDQKKLADHILDTLLAEVTKEDQGAGIPTELMAAIAKIEKLEEATVAHLAERYRRAKSQDERDLAVLLAIATGGSEVSALLATWLESRSATGDGKDGIMRTLAGILSPFEMKPFSVNADLQGWAERLSRSEDKLDRMGSVGIYRNDGSAGARSRLRDLALDTESSDVRSAAVRALGMTGDASDLEFLRRYPKAMQEGSVSRHLEKAIQTLEKK